MENIFINTIDLTDNGRVTVTGYTTYGNYNVTLSEMIPIDKPPYGIWNYSLGANLTGDFGVAMLTPFSVSAPWIGDDDANGLRIIHGFSDTAPVTELLLLKAKPVDSFSKETNNSTELIAAAYDSQSGHLVIDIQYTGGCHEHHFSLEWDGATYKSNPPQYVLNLVDLSPADNCEAIVSSQLRVDIRNLDFDPVSGSTIHVSTPKYGRSLPVIIG